MAIQLHILCWQNALDTNSRSLNYCFFVCDLSASAYFFCVSLLFLIEKRTWKSHKKTQPTFSMARLNIFAMNTWTRVRQRWCHRYLLRHVGYMLRQHLTRNCVRVRFSSPLWLGANRDEFLRHFSLWTFFSNFRSLFLMALIYARSEE